MGYPVSYILRNCLNDVKDLCRLIPEDEVIMKIKRRNPFWRTFISNWIEDRDLALETVLGLKNGYWANKYISNVRGLIESNDDSVGFYVFNRFCSFSPLNCLIKSEKMWPRRWDMLKELEIISKRGLKNRDIWVEEGNELCDVRDEG